MKFIFSFVHIVVLFCSFIQADGKIYFTSPLFTDGNTFGKHVSNVVNVELVKIEMDGNFKKLAKVKYNVDTLLRNKFQRNEIERNSNGYLSHLPDLPVDNDGSVLLIYDISSHSKGVNMPDISGNIIYEHIVAGLNTINNFDTIICKISLFDLTHKVNPYHQALFITEDSCKDEPLDCLLQAIYKFDRNNAGVIDKEKILSVPDKSYDQHWGKIIGGTGIIAGGILFTAAGLAMESPALIVPGSLILSTGVTLEVFGIIRQVKYFKWRKDYQWQKDYH